MRHGWLVRLAVLALAPAFAACQGGGGGSGSASGRGTAAAAATADTLSRSDQLLLAAAKVALPPPGVSPGDLPDPSSRGAQLVVEYCAQCHSLPTPTMHSLTDWPSVARRMWLRMEWLPVAQGVKVPTTADRYVMLEYLTANALKVSGAVLPAGPGRDKFAVVCSQCHALPDPRVHSPADWPTVYARMERNMERMLVKPPAGTAGTDILLYLQTVAGKRAPAPR